MKKLLLTTLTLLSAFTFISCEEPTEEKPQEGYTLTVTPTTIKAGEKVTFAVTGEGAEDLTWSTCYDVIEGDGAGSCLSPFVKEIALNVVGKYEFYSHTMTESGEEIEADNRVIVTVTE